MKKTIAVLLILVMLVAALAACGGGNGGGSSAKKDSVTLATNMVISSIHPEDCASLQNNQIRMQVYESFFYFDDKTKKFEPRVATDYTVSDDGLTYTFTLRDGVKFHNGDELTVEDILYTIDLAFNTPSILPYIQGLDHAEKVDDKHVALVLSEPNSAFMSKMNGVLGIVSKRACEEATGDLTSTPILGGTGPYYIDTYNPDVEIVMKAFPDYYRGEAAIKTVTFKPIIDNSTGLVAFENGELDFYNIPTSNWKEIVDSGKYNTELTEANHCTFFDINYTGVLEDIRVREAIAHCIDKQAMIDGAYDGLASIATCVCNPKYVVGAPSDGITYDYDLEKAKKLLAEAGYPNGVDVGKILCPAGTYFEKMAVILQQTLASIGVTVDIDAMEQSASIAQMLTGDFDIVCSGYMGQYVYAYWMANAHSSSDATMPVKTGRAPASAGILTKEIDEGFDKALASTDEAEILKYYKQADDAIMKSIIQLPVFHKGMPYAWNKDLNASPRSSYYMVYEWSWK